MSFLVLFFLKIILATQGPLQFCVNLRIDFSISAKKSVGILTEISVNVLTTLGRSDNNVASSDP